MSRYVDVLPDPGRALSQLFTYRVPDSLQKAVQVGAQVLIPFGPRTVVGVVARLSEQSDRAGLKDLEAVLEDVPVLPQEALDLAAWMADYYLCELGEALRPLLPQGTTYRIGRRFRLSGNRTPSSLRRDRDTDKLLRHMERIDSDVSLPALRRLLPPPRLSRAIRLLKSHDLVVERASLLPPRARARQVRVVEPAVSQQEVEDYCREHAHRAPARVACLRSAFDAGSLLPGELAVRAGVSVSTVQALVKQGLLRARWTPRRRVPWAEAAAEPGPPLAPMPEQEDAVREISDAAKAGRATPFLLYGVTASGKTEVFLRVIERVLAQDRQAIVLTPEISLTAQALGIYRTRFGDRVAILHSGLSIGERWDEWQRIRSAEASVVIGARSAVFAPTPALGLIVVDEEHETSYKQDQAPRYHAREVALRRGKLSSCPVVLASATPALETFYHAQLGTYHLLSLPRRVEDRPLPHVRIVDMRTQRSSPSQRRQPSASSQAKTAAQSPAIFSPVLQQAITDRLAAGEQVILFLNRRGFATFILCPVCGESLRCPDCGVALKYHRDQRKVRCHHCGLSRLAPDVCSRCGGSQIRFSGFGTERVQKELERIFPRARHERMDRDTTSRKGAHVRIVGQFRAAETDVLIGTQMVAKGFDFPGVTLVGIISADTSLNLPDFRAAERTFQLLTQASGRSGRGERTGKVIIQTYLPQHYSIQAAAEHDYPAFYREEIGTRRELGYPPLSHLVNLVISADDEAEAAARTERISQEVRRRAHSLTDRETVEVLGPAPAPLARLRRKHRWHLLVRGGSQEVKRLVKDALLATGEWGKSGLVVDVDPVSLM
jgi:primosomal protein N' (replication factor Y)